ncbi:MAG TPA: ATP-dependent DNA helicase RecG, partial [Paludibacter sp.]|nr:ATP-dependent DNA helicase RecG [Paludibacter sp.]
MPLADIDIKFIPGVGPKKADLLAKELNIRTVEDMVRHYPYRYVDRSRFYFVHEISENMPFIQLKGQILQFNKIGEGRSQRLSATFTDGKDTIELVWFQGLRFILNKYKTGVTYVVFGKPSFFNGKYNIPHPEID